MDLVSFRSHELKKHYHLHHQPLFLGLLIDFSYLSLRDLCCLEMRLTYLSLLLTNTFGETHCIFRIFWGLYLEHPGPFVVIGSSIVTSSNGAKICEAASASVEWECYRKILWSAKSYAPFKSFKFPSDQYLKEDSHFWDTYGSILYNSLCLDRKQEA